MFLNCGCHYLGFADSRSANLLRLYSSYLRLVLVAFRNRDALNMLIDGVHQTIPYDLIKFDCDAVGASIHALRCPYHVSRSEYVHYVYA